MNVLARSFLTSRTGASAPEPEAGADGAAPDAFAEVLERIGAGAPPPATAGGVTPGETAAPGPASPAEAPETASHELGAGVLRGGLDLSAAAAPVVGEGRDTEAAGGAPPLDRQDPSASAPAAVPGTEVAALVASSACLSGPVPPAAPPDGTAPDSAGRVDPRVRSLAHPHAPHERTQDAFRAPPTSSSRASPYALSAPDARAQESSYRSAPGPASSHPLAGPDAGSPAAPTRTGESSPSSSAHPGSPRSRPAPSARWPSSAAPNAAMLPSAAPGASTPPPTGPTEATHPSAVPTAATHPSAVPAATAPPSTGPSAGTPSSAAPTAGTSPSATPSAAPAESATLSSTPDGRLPETARTEPVEGRATRGAPEAPTSPPLAPAPSRGDAAPAPQAQRADASAVAHGDPAVRAGAARSRRDDQAPHAARARPDATPASSDGQPNRFPVAAADGAAPELLATDALGVTERDARDPARAREGTKRAGPGAREADADGRSALAAAPAPLPQLATEPFLADARAEAARPRTPVAPPLPVLPLEPGEAIVSGAVLPSVAHLHLSSETLGEVALHLRILDGAAHVRVEGGPRGAVEPRAPELARALAAEGLHLARLEHEPNSSHSSGGGGASSGGDLPREGGSRDASGHSGGDTHHGDRQSGDGATARPASPRTGPRGSRKHGGAHDVTA